MLNYIWFGLMAIALLVAIFMGTAPAVTKGTIDSTKDTATNAMVSFMALNTAGIQLIPATIIGVLSAAGSKNPTAIIVTRSWRHSPARSLQSRRRRRGLVFE